MGVHDLWRLLAPCGHRLSLTTLSRRRLAIDVSIWLAQFVKALPTSQPHLLGLLRRLCKLHFYHIYPVLVFDGPAPMLKKRTLDQRRRVREKQRESFERVAERLLLEQLKLKSVAQLRRQLKKKKKEEEEEKKGEDDKRSPGKEEKEAEASADDVDDDVQVIEKGGEGEVAGVKKRKRKRKAPAVKAEDEAALLRVIDEADDDPELLLIRQLQAEEDAAGSAGLFTQWQTQDDDEPPPLQSSTSRSSPIARRARLLTSLTAEERQLGRSALLPSDDEEEAEPIPLPEVADPLSYQLPASGDLDATVLASLPISLQYSLLEQHRSHHHTLSMRRYAAVKGDMSAFSAMQMGAFLKQVEFNQQIDKKRVEMNSGEEVDGFKVRRLAGDGGKQFIYHKKDEKKEKEALRLKEEEEEQRRKAESRQEREKESARYIHSHLSRIKEREHSEWQCGDCGHHNAVTDNATPAVCHSCGAARKLRPADGGTVNILMGAAASPVRGQTKQEAPAKAERVAAATRVTTHFERKGGAAAAGKVNEEAASLYWSCRECHFLNPLERRTCEICSSAKDDSAQPVLVDLTTSPHKPPPSSRHPSHTDIIHVSEDEDHQQPNPPRSSSASPATAAAAAALEISFDPTAKSGAEDDVFPEDFFSAFDDPTSAPLPPVHPLPPPTVWSPPSAVAKASSPPSSTSSLLLPSMTVREAEKIRRPRMRLKKLDVREIIWFDEDDEGSRPVAVPKRLPAEELKVAEQPSWDDEVEEIFVRGRAKLIKKGDPLPPPPPNPHPVLPVQLDSTFLEEEEPQDMQAELEGKYDEDEEGQEEEEAGGRGDDGETRDARRELKDAMALSLSFAVNREEEVHEDVVVEEWEGQRKPLVVIKPREREQRALDSIAEGEEEMKEELESQQRSEDRDQLVIVDRNRPESKEGEAVQSERTVIRLQSDAVRAEDCGDELGSQVTMTVAVSAAVPEEDDKAKPPSPPAAVEPVLSDPALATAPSSMSSPTVVEHEVAEVRPTETSAPRGFVLPSLASLTSAPTAVQSTNLFYAERQQRQQQQQQQASMPALGSTSDPSSSPSAATTSTASPPAPRATSSSAGSPPPTSSARPSDQPIAVWSSAGDDFPRSTDSEHDQHLSNLMAESYVVSSSLSRQKQKQAKQQQQVTPQMLDECRHLLSLFGCPYIISPAEAEAQCATLEMLGLVDGVVTEDSDVFLFGARNVYRNMFEQKKYAERYRVEEVDAVLGLDREDLISLALLLGSDYTEGVHGVGIVNAMEIVNAFPGQGNAGLREFREWVYSGSAEKRPRIPELKEAVEGEAAEAKVERDRVNAELVHAYRKALFKYKHRNVRSSWHVSRDFPSDAVRAGYEEPMVDRSEEALTWAKPRWDDIVEFLRDKFREEEEERKREGRAEREEAEWVAMVTTLRVAWEEEEARAAANPAYQTQLDLYFRADDRFAEVKSRRINSAIAGLTRQRGEVDREKEREEQEQANKRAKKAKAKGKRKSKGQEGGEEEEARRVEGDGDDKENEAGAAAAASPAKGEASPGRGREARGSRGRGGGRGGEVASRLTEAKERKQREDAEWLDDDDVVLVHKEGEEDGGDDDWTPTRKGRGKGRGRGGRGRSSGSSSSVAVKRGRGN